MKSNFLLFGMRVISHLPLAFHYSLSKFLYVLLRYLIKYRESVIDTNLVNSFPQKRRDEIIKIKKDFYRNFSNFIVETLKLLTINEKALRKRIILSEDSFSELRNCYWRNQNIIILSGHIFNWEFCALFPVILDYKVLITYKKLKNDFWENVMKEMRQRFGGLAVDYRHTYHTMMKLNNEKLPVLTWICGDQMPTLESKILVEDHFLNQKTYFFNGVNQLAKRTNSAVYFLNMSRSRESVYHASLKLITSEPNAVDDHFIMNRYSKLLEELIITDPGNWLWSHNRWKIIQVRDRIEFTG